MVSLRVPTNPGNHSVVRTQLSSEASTHPDGLVVLVATIVASVLSSSLVLAVTLTKTARQVQQASSLGLKATLSEIMLRDG